jgi:hypothetical protein
LLLDQPITAEAQQAKKIPGIGYLSIGDPATESTRSEQFRLALRELGYIEGQNIATEYRYGEGKQERFPEVAAEPPNVRIDVACGKKWKAGRERERK